MAEIYDGYDKLVSQGRMDKRRQAQPPVVVDDNYISFKKPEGNPSAEEMIKFITDTIVAHSLGEAIKIADATNSDIEFKLGNMVVKYYSNNGSGFWTNTN